MNKNWYFLGVCILLISTGILVISSSIVSSLNLFNNTNGNSKVNLKNLPNIAQDIAWDIDGNPVCIDSAVSQDYLEICSDGVGGTIIVWDDKRNGTLNSNVFAQHIDSNGDALWGNDGIEISTAGRDQRYPKICSDGAGGAIITWQDDRDTSDWDIYAQRIDSNGTVQWTSNGIAICTEVDDQRNPQLCSDGIDGAIITWQDKRSGTDWDIYAKRIDSDGNTEWGGTNGIAISNEDDNQWYYQIIGDGAGGAILTWEDSRGTDDDVYAKRIDSGGNTEWGGTNGMAICTEENRQWEPRLCSDGTGGAVITWQDERTGYEEWDIYAQYIDSGGNIEWDVNGTIICNADGEQVYPYVCSDGGGGDAIITWQDERSGSNWDIYAQYIDSGGNIEWDVNGTTICNADGDQRNPQLCSDGIDGAIITWQDKRGEPSNDYDDIYAQRINSSGIAKWENNGIVLCNENNLQGDPKIISDGLGGAIIAWEDERDGDFDLYAQRIENPPPTSNHPADITTTMDGTETINWTLSDDSGGGQYRVMANLTGGSDYIVSSWTSWTNGTTLNIPINRTSTGTFAYRIEYYDNQNRYGTSDTVIVQITEPKSSISGYNILILALSVYIIGVIFTIRLRKKKNSS